MAFHIRPLHLTDIPAFHHALDSVCREQTFLLDSEAPPLDRLADSIQSHLCNHYPFAIAEQQGRIIGWADITLHQRQSLKHTAKLGMGVIQGKRGKGIGQALLSQVIDEADALGITRIELEVLSSNLPAIGLYRKLGFELEGTKRNAAMIRGQYLDMHFMAKLANARW